MESEFEERVVGVGILLFILFFYVFHFIHNNHVFAYYLFN